MEITNETPMREITVAGTQLQAPAPYAEGHTLNENEAAVLNQTLAENLRNNFASRVGAAVEKAAVENGLAEADEDGKVKLDKETRAEALEYVDTVALQQEFLKYVQNYEFGVRRGGGGAAAEPADPVEREALKLASDKVKAAIKAKGLNLKDVGAAKIRELAEQAVANNPAIKEHAARIVEMKKEIGGESLDLDLD